MNTVRELSQVPLLEPLLIKKTFTNISRELVDIGTAIKHLENRSLKSEDAEANYKACQVSMNGTEHRLYSWKINY